MNEPNEYEISDEPVTERDKRTMVDQLVMLATDTRTGAWPSRLYLAAAIWLESETEPNGDDRTLITSAAERVKAKDASTVPPNFDGFVWAWLHEGRK